MLQNEKSGDGSRQNRPKTVNRPVLKCFTLPHRHNLYQYDSMNFRHPIHLMSHLKMQKMFRLGNQQRAKSLQRFEPVNRKKV